MEIYVEELTLEQLWALIQMKLLVYDEENEKK